MHEPRELPIVAGHVALDFANTIDDPEGPARHDHLSTYHDLLTWSSRVAVLATTRTRRLRAAASANPRAAATVVRRAHDLRAALNGTFGAVAVGARPDVEHWAVLRRFAAEGLGRADLAGDAVASELVWADRDDLQVMLWPVADQAIDLLRSDALSRVKRCAGCPWLFVDSSRNSSRRWCSMDDCGTHEKIRRYVERRAARRQ